MSDHEAEQKAADEALTEAIEKVHAAYYEGSDSVLTDYIVISARRSWGENGEGLTWTAMHPRDGDMPLYSQMGLAEYALTIARRQAGSDS